MNKKGFVHITVIISLLAVGAMAVFMLYANKLNEVLVPQNTPTSEVLEYGMSDWETYENATNGYKLKFPNSWTVSEGIQTPEINSEHYTSIACCNLSLDASVNIFVEELITPQEFLVSIGMTNPDVIESTLNIYSASTASFENHKWIFINHDNKTYILNSWGSASEEEIRDQILSTFEFIN